MDKKYDLQTLESNLRKAPYLCNTIGYDNIIKEAQSNPGSIAIYFGNPQFEEYQHYLESVFQTIKHYNIEYRKKKFKKDLLSPDNDNSVLTEIEVAAKLAPYFKITPEYPIDKLQPKSKNLDLLIEDESNGERVLIEIATKRSKFTGEFTEEAVVTIVGDIIKNSCNNKMEEQLGYIQSKNIDLKCPLILLFKYEGIYYPNFKMFESDSLTGLYGDIQITRDHKSEMVKYSRANNGFYDAENIDFISMVGYYQLGFDDKYIFDGKLIAPKYPPKYKMSTEFLQKFANTLFS
ncbi:MAG: hypothetical protein ACPK85_15670 [Methanosarcina sp.]